MPTNFQRVREFHEVFNCDISDTPKLPDEPSVDLRVDLIEEELDELYEGLKNDDIVEVADALTDMLYVVYGAGVTFGIDLDKCFEEVHRSNMSKLDENGNPVLRDDGKVMKGPNFSHPDLKKVLYETVS